MQTFVERGLLISDGTRLVVKERAALLAETLPRRLGIQHEMSVAAGQIGTGTATGMIGTATASATGTGS
jgi:hypothetical protein